MAPRAAPPVGELRRRRGKAKGNPSPPRSPPRVYGDDGISRRARGRKPSFETIIRAPTPGLWQGAVPPTHTPLPSRPQSPTRCGSRPNSAGFSGGSSISYPACGSGVAYITEGSDGKAKLSLSIGAAGLQQNAAGAPTRPAMA